MMKRQFSRFTVPELVIGSSVFILLLLVAILIFGHLLYQDILKDKLAGQDEAKEAVMTRSALEEIEEVTRYHGKRPYFVIEGRTKKGEKAVAFAPGNKEGKILLFLQRDLLSPEEVISTWNNQCGNCRLIDYKWAMENRLPLLEVTYIGKSNRYVFEYFKMENGKTYKRLSLKRSQY